LHPVGILFPHINDDARSKSHKKYAGWCLGLSFFKAKLKLLNRNRGIIVCGALQLSHNV